MEGLIELIGVIVPRRFRADWRQEWEVELRYREALLADWAKLNWQTKLDLLRRSVGAFGMRCCYNHADGRTKCFKTCALACDCC